MCELLGLSARLPTRLTFSLQRFAAHGGRVGRHRDGWGMAFYDAADLQLFREPRAAAASPLVEFLERRGPASRMILSHIRYATSGAVCLANTHPFQRELGGRMHVFAHNGSLPGIRERMKAGRGPFRPVGETDSEYAFCLLLEDLADLWQTADPPPLERRIEHVRRFAQRLARLGPANFLYADGTFLFAHGHRRRQEDGTIRPPGLWMLGRSCAIDPKRTEDAGVQIHTEAQQVALLASVPLSDEPWCPLAEGELLVLEAGRIVARRRTADPAPDRPMGEP